MSEKIIPVILDGDPGHDDAIAWVIAAASKRIKILGCSAVNGNCSVDKAAYNAQRVCALLNLDVPIAAGQSKPLYIQPISAPSNIHGESGLDGPALPEPRRELEELDAVELMAKLIEESDEKVTIVATGPLTNVAALITNRHDLKNNIERISIMGGGILYGNWTPAAEFNILVDPDSADIVFNSGIDIIMSGLDVTEKALVFPEDVQAIREINNPVSDIVWQWLEFFYKFHKSIGYAGAPLHDPCAVMVLLHPQLFELKQMYVQVETCGTYTTGCTVGDYYNVTGNKPNVSCVMNVDRQGFIDQMVQYIKRYSEVK